MPAPISVIPRLEGIVSSIPSDAPENRAGQFVAAWVEMCKMIMRLPGNESLTDWDLFASTIDLDETEETIDASAATLYAVLARSIETEDIIISTYNAANPTLASTDLNDGGNLSTSFFIEDAASAAAADAVYAAAVWPHGIAHATALTIGASERDEGTAVAANAVRVWVLYRTA